MSIKPPPGRVSVLIGKFFSKEWLEWFDSIKRRLNSIFTSMGQNKIQKDLTFSDDAAGALTLFTVTGDVYVTIIPVITTDLTSVAGANIRLGIVGDTDSMIVDTVATALDARGVWFDKTPNTEIEPLDRKRAYIIADGNNIILTLDAQVDAGAITFYCFWTGLSADGNVVAA